MFSGDNPNKSVRKQIFIYNMKNGGNKGLKESHPRIRKTGICPAWVYSIAKLKKDSLNILSGILFNGFSRA